MCVPEREPGTPGQLVWEDDGQEQLHRVVLSRWIRRDLERLSREKTKAQVCLGHPSSVIPAQADNSGRQTGVFIAKEKVHLGQSWGSTSAIGVTPQP